MPSIFREPGVALAYEFLEGDGPVVVFCSGYASDMGGTKALALEASCRTRGQAMLRFDYAGHGQSGGDFLDGTIGAWAADAEHIVRAVLEARPIILVGSSMGGWIALLLGLRLQNPLAGMILIAPAADFTEILVRANLTPEQEAELAEKGVLYEPSEYGPPLPWTKKLLDEGARHQLLGGKIGIICPVHFLHGMHDDSVPWKLSLRISEALESEAVRLTFVKDGDHRLSRPEDLALLDSALTGLLGQNGA